MQHYFELYILTDHLQAEQWTKLYKALTSYLGVLGKFEIVFTCTDNMVRFFVVCDKDLSSVSNNLDGILLRPVSKDEFKLPTAANKERLVQFVTGGNILDLKEKYAVKKAKNLEYAVFKIRSINVEKAIVRSNMYFKNAGGTWSKSSRSTSFLPVKLLDINFEQNARYLKRSTPKYLNIEKSLHMLLSDNVNAVFEVDTFPYFSHNYYLNLSNYEFDKHSFIIGASGSGKSKLITLIVDRLQRTQLKMNYRVVIIDPHAAIAEDVAHIPNSKTVNFDNESTELFSDATADISAATELTATLFKSLLGDQFNNRLDRLLRYSLFVLMTAQAMSLNNLKRFQTEVEYRNQVLSHVDGYVPQNVVKFFGADYNELRTQHYNETILPVVSLVDEMQMQPSLVRGNDQSLAKMIQDNFLTVFSLNKVSMGEKVTKTVAGLLIQQIFLLAQARAFNQKVILIIDEVSVVQNPAIAQILAEARKFNLTVILTQQYFGQVEKDLQAAIFSNVYNYYAFKVSEDDARALEGNLNIEIAKELVEAAGKKGQKESDIRIKMMTDLHPRECLVRVVSNGQVVPAIKARTVDAPHGAKVTTAPAAKLTAVLPEKFVEGSGSAQQPIHFSKEFVEQLAQNHDTTKLSGIKENIQSKRAFSSIKDMLAEHSSSRDKARKRKEK
ncbi:MAG: hypothetical protein QG553_359 [Patescibacteria group bacterium]|nr:hypothetical protein [Patescibacteria group bacterium]